ncbi:unnamed protein product [Cochlearia groenlandica]
MCDHQLNDVHVIEKTIWSKGSNLIRDKKAKATTTKINRKGALFLIWDSIDNTFLLSLLYMSSAHSSLHEQFAYNKIST